eukprot:TRINITY_DN7822_c0_g2_i1.p1 TRINITY_DN7822_c0_g2~~TRINITY_DN7822_c0_g2_i1.p1  ORF type:complete len:167 (-),score=53.67 TRINITY_DN7822_c0_g2_i1:182-655(-)
MIRRPPRSTHCISSAASDVYKRQVHNQRRVLEQFNWKMMSKEILVAEDDKFCQMMLTGILKSSGAVATMTEDGDKCVKAFKASPQKFKLILMDICMPVMDGYKAAEAIRKIDPKITIIGLSGDNDEKTVAAAKKAGMTKIIQKPLKKAEIQAIIKET